MRSQFLLIPAALIASAPAQAAYQYVTEEQGLARLFPKAEFTPTDLTMSIAQTTALKQQIGKETPFFIVSIRAWKVSTGGWVFLDGVLAHGAAIIYLVGVNPDGSIKGIEVLECDANYASIQSQSWLQQFTGKRLNDAVELMRKVQIISGTTQSCEAIAAGVRRVMTAYELFFMAQGNGG